MSDCQIIIDHENGDSHGPKILINDNSSGNNVNTWVCVTFRELMKISNLAIESQDNACKGLL